MGLTALDIIVLVLVIGGAVQGARKGFVTEVLSLVAWIFTVFALRVLQVPVTGLLASWIATEGGATVLAFLLIAGGSYAAGGGSHTRSASARAPRCSGPLTARLGLALAG